MSIGDECRRRSLECATALERGNRGRALERGTIARTFERGKSGSALEYDQSCRAVERDRSVGAFECGTSGKSCAYSSVLCEAWQHKRDFCKKKRFIKVCIRAFFLIIVIDTVKLTDLFCNRMIFVAICARRLVK